MSHDRRTTRTPNASLATTASALIALVAIAAVMSSVTGSGANIRAAMLETRSGAVESPSVRSVAAAVVAAARELAGAERITAALPSQLLIVIASAGAPSHVHFDTGLVIRSRVIDEHLIDLPPPVC